MSALFSLQSPKGYFNASYGVVPKFVRDYHAGLLARVERNPYRWFTRDCGALLTQTRARLAEVYLKCDPGDVVFVDNSSSGANSVFDAVRPEVVVLLDTAYGMIRELARKYAQTVVMVDAFPLDSVAKRVGEAVKKLETGKKVLVCVDHVASCPGVLIPVAEIARAACAQHKVPVFVDGAHALGQVELDLRDLESAGVTHWVTDAHKWFFSPKGAAVLWARRDQHDALRPRIDCAGIGSPGCEFASEVSNSTKSTLLPTPFQKRFNYLGTKDYTPWIAVNGAMDFVETQVWGYRALLERNHNLAVWAQGYMAQRLGTLNKVSRRHTAAMCNVRLPSTENFSPEALLDHLESLGIYTVVFEYPLGSRRFWIRLCVQCFVNEQSVENVTNELVRYFRADTPAGACCTAR